MTTLSADEVRALASKYWSDPKNIAMATRIAWLESRYNTNAHNTVGRDNSYGIMQINMKGDLGADRRQRFGIQNVDLFNPEINMRVARGIWEQNGNSFMGSAGWSTSAAASSFLGGTGSSNDDGSPDSDTPSISASDRAALEQWLDDNLPQPQLVEWEDRTVKSQKSLLRDLLNDEDIEIPENIRAIMEAFIAGEHEPGIGEVISDPNTYVPDFSAIPGNIAELLRGLLPTVGWYLLVGLLAIAALFLVTKSIK